MKLKTIKSGFAILDVKAGRQWLYRYFIKPPGEDAKPIKVKIEGHIVGVWGNDDGISREFEIKVDKVTLK